QAPHSRELVAFQATHKTIAAFHPYSAPIAARTSFKPAETNMNRRYIPLLAAAAMAVPHAAAAQEMRNPAPRIVVVGEGEAAVVPDMAVITLSVLREAETAREALDQNNK